MPPPEPAPTAAPTAAFPGRGAGLRLAGVLLLAAVVGAAAWLAFRSPAGSDDPASVFDYVRDRTLGGDGSAAWRLLLPKAREAYAGMIRNLREEKSSAHASQAAEWRRRTGISREDLNRLPPEDLFARESLAAAPELYRGARVYSVDRRGPGEAVLRICLGNGSDRLWNVRRVGGTWRIENLWAVEVESPSTIGRTGGPAPPPPGRR